MGRSVVVTGASTGIGAACVERLAGSDWTVFAGVRRDADGEQLASRIAGDVRPLRLDVRDDDQIADAISQVGSDVGAWGLDGLVNNAGIGLGGPIELASTETWRTQFEVNLFGTLALTRTAFPLLRTAGGRIVFMGSQAGRISLPLIAPYAASKHALVAVCEALQQELRYTPMEVALVEPGGVKTPIWDKAHDEVREIEAAIPDDRRRHYAHTVPAFHGLVAQSQRFGIPPARVANRVEHALTAARPKPRYPIGPDMWLLGGLVSRFPARMRRATLAGLVHVLGRVGAKTQQRTASDDRVGTGATPASR